MTTLVPDCHEQAIDAPEPTTAAGLALVGIARTADILAIEAEACAAVDGCERLREAALLVLQSQLISPVKRRPIALAIALDALREALA